MATKKTTDCTLWDGPTFGPGGYGVTKEGKRGLVIRKLWLEAGREIPKKALLRPQCGNKSCINLEHWELELDAY